MNANELSEIIEHLENARYIGASKASEMLRQQQEQIENLKQWERRHLDVIEKQQAEIQALKQIIDANNLSQNIGQFVKAANEPVAWMDDLSFFTEQPDDMDGVTPLYTHQYERPHNTVLVPCDKLAEMQAEIETLKAHPVKELTDEEIIKVYEDMLGVASAKGSAIDFARAILRKAQE